tara:strand:+ start:34 stop:237 length:204 start_codon:yes stop_codon:yes gene_type:complete
MARSTHAITQIVDYMRLIAGAFADDPHQETLTIHRQSLAPDADGDVDETTFEEWLQTSLAAIDAEDK